MRYLGGSRHAATAAKPAVKTKSPKRKGKRPPSGNVTDSTAIGAAAASRPRRKGKRHAENGDEQASHRAGQGRGHGQNHGPAEPVGEQRGRGQHADGQSQPERHSADDHIGHCADPEQANGDAHCHGRFGQPPPHHHGKRPRGQHAAGDTHGPHPEHGPERWEKQRISRGVVAAVPLVVPLGEANPAEQVDPVELGRPIGAPPTEGKGNNPADARQKAAEHR